MADQDIDGQISVVWSAIADASKAGKAKQADRLYSVLTTLQFLKKHQVTVRPFIQAAIKMGKSLQAVDGGGAQD